MSRTVLVVAVALVVGGLLALNLFGDSGPDERTQALEREVEVLRDSTAELRKTVQVVDSVAAVEIREVRQTRAEQDTIFQNKVDTIRTHLPERFQPTLDSLVHADSVEDAAYERQILALERKVETRDSLINGLEAQLKAQAELTDRLRERLNPSFFESLLDSTGPGVACGLTTTGQLGCAVGIGVSF